MTDLAAQWNPHLNQYQLSLFTSSGVETTLLTAPTDSDETTFKRFDESISNVFVFRNEIMAADVALLISSSGALLILPSFESSLQITTETNPILPLSVFPHPEDIPISFASNPSGNLLCLMFSPEICVFYSLNIQSQPPTPTSSQHENQERSFTISFSQPFLFTIPSFFIHDICFAMPPNSFTITVDQSKPLQSINMQYSSIFAVTTTSKNGELGAQASLSLSYHLITHNDESPLTSHFLSPASISIAINDSLENKIPSLTVSPNICFCHLEQKSILHSRHPSIPLALRFFTETEEKLILGSFITTLNVFPPPSPTLTSKKLKKGVLSYRPISFVESSSPLPQNLSSYALVSRNSHELIFCHYLQNGKAETVDVKVRNSVRMIAAFITPSELFSGTTPPSPPCLVDLADGSGLHLTILVDSGHGPPQVSTYRIGRIIDAITQEPTLTATATDPHPVNRSYNQPWFTGSSLCLVPNLSSYRNHQTGMQIDLALSAPDFFHPSTHSALLSPPFTRRVKLNWSPLPFTTQRKLLCLSSTLNYTRDRRTKQFPSSSSFHASDSSFIRFENTFRCKGISSNSQKSSRCFIWRVSPTETFVVLSEPEKTRFFAYPADRMKAIGEVGIGGHVAASQVAQFEQNGEHTSYFMMISPNSVILFAKGSKVDEKSGRTCRVTNFRNIIDLENIGRIQSISTHHAVFHCPFRFSAPFPSDRDRPFVGFCLVATQTPLSHDDVSTHPPSSAFRQSLVHNLVLLGLRPPSRKQETMGAIQIKQISTFPLESSLIALAMTHIGEIASPFDISTPNCLMIAFITKCHPEKVELVTIQNPFTLLSLPRSFPPPSTTSLHPHTSRRSVRAAPNIISLRFSHSTHSTFPLLLAGSSDGILSSIPITPNLFHCLDSHVFATHAAPSLPRRLGTHPVVFGSSTQLSRDTPNPLSVFLIHCGITFLCFDHPSLAIHPTNLASHPSCAVFAEVENGTTRVHVAHTTSDTNNVHMRVSSTSLADRSLLSGWALDDRFPFPLRPSSQVCVAATLSPLALMVQVGLEMVTERHRRVGSVTSARMFEMFTPMERASSMCFAAAIQQDAFFPSAILALPSTFVPVAVDARYESEDGDWFGVRKEGVFVCSYAVGLSSADADKAHLRTVPLPSICRSGLFEKKRNMELPTLPLNCSRPCGLVVVKDIVYSRTSGIVNRRERFRLSVANPVNDLALVDDRFLLIAHGNEIAQVDLERRRPVGYTLLRTDFPIKSLGVMPSRDWRSSKKAGRGRRKGKGVVLGAKRRKVEIGKQDIADIEDSNSESSSEWKEPTKYEIESDLSEHTSFQDHSRTIVVGEMPVLFPQLLQKQPFPVNARRKNGINERRSVSKLESPKLSPTPSRPALVEREAGRSRREMREREMDGMALRTDVVAPNELHRAISRQEVLMNTETPVLGEEERGSEHLEAIEAEGESPYPPLPPRQPSTPNPFNSASASVHVPSSPFSGITLRSQFTSEAPQFSDATTQSSFQSPFSASIYLAAHPFSQPLADANETPEMESMRQMNGRRMISNGRVGVGRRNGHGVGTGQRQGQVVENVNRMFGESGRSEGNGRRMRSEEIEREERRERMEREDGMLRGVERNGQDLLTPPSPTHFEGIPFLPPTDPETLGRAEGEGEGDRIDVDETPSLALWNEGEMPELLVTSSFIEEPPRLERRRGEEDGWRRERVRGRGRRERWEEREVEGSIVYLPRPTHARYVERSDGLELGLGGEGGERRTRLTRVDQTLSSPPPPEEGQDGWRGLVNERNSNGTEYIREIQMLSDVFSLKTILKESEGHTQPTMTPIKRLIGSEEFEDDWWTRRDVLGKCLETTEEFRLKAGVDLIVNEERNGVSVVELRRQAVPRSVRVGRDVRWGADGDFDRAYQDFCFPQTMTVQGKIWTRQLEPLVVPAMRCEDDESTSWYELVGSWGERRSREGRNGVVGGRVGSGRVVWRDNERRLVRKAWGLERNRMLMELEDGRRVVKKLALKGREGLGHWISCLLSGNNSVVCLGREDRSLAGSTARTQPRVNMESLLFRQMAEATSCEDDRKALSDKEAERRMERVEEEEVFLREIGASVFIEKDEGTLLLVLQSLRLHEVAL